MARFCFPWTVRDRSNGMCPLVIVLVIVVSWCGTFPKALAGKTYLTEMEVIELSERAHFIFEGTIENINAKEEHQFVYHELDVRVTVDNVLKVPATLGNYMGQTVIVRLNKPYQAPSGKRRLWFTNVWRYDRYLGVREIDSVVYEQETKDFRQLVEREIKDLPDRLLKRYLAQADLVVVGRVIDVQRTKRLRQDRAKPSEHNPQWHEAVLAVKSVEHGKLDRRQITVLFPASRDVMWIQVPKFHVDQEAVLVLYEMRISEDESMIFTVKHAADVRPKSELARIRKLVRE